MKRILFCLLLFAGVAQAQTYNNEWIDFSKTYYKFKVGSTGLKRIPQSTLAAAGLGSADAQDFQLWRNGKQVPIYTSVPAGAFSASDYIEFWGLMNDGAPDRELYRFPTSLLNDKWSLETDTAVYFLTVNASGNNLRLVNTANNVAGNSLPAEPYFMYTAGNYFKNQINGGYAVNVGEYMFSSTYDRGEGWSSSNIGTNGSNSFTFSNLFPYTTGPDAKFFIAVSGNATNPRRYRANLNGDSLIGHDVNFLNELRDSTIFPVSRLSTGSAAIVVSNLTTYANDRMVIHKYEITYPRQFNFGGASNFEFVLPASAGSKYLQITGFSYGAVAPVLYDLTNGKRYVGDISTAGQVKIVLEPSSTERQLVLVGEEAANISSIQTLTSRTFTDFRQAINQSDYMIISNPILFSGPNGSNPVDEYRAYRSSIAGGSYNAKIYLVEDLVDQFGFGIKKSPAAIRNFLWFARNRFVSVPKQVFLIGKGVTYVVQRGLESNPDIERQNLVPTFGNPASDGMLSADPGTSDPAIPIGRLSVIDGQEVKDYLSKVKEFELSQQTPSPLIADKAWMKNVVHAVGASEPGLLASIDSYMNGYKQIIKDTLFGGNVTTFTKSSPNSVEQVAVGELDRLFTEGITLLTYFGHSSTSNLEFNLNNADQYSNQGKYPLFLAQGCNAGNCYTFNTTRFSSKITLTEQFVLAPNRGTIGFIASSHFGITDYLDIYNRRIYEQLGVKSYGKSIGEILKAAIKDVFSYTTQDDFYARATCEESNLNGDPAIKLNPHAKPDYAVEDQNVRVNPAFVSVADASFNLKAKFYNIGKAINRDIVVQVKRDYPNGTSAIVYRDTIPGIRYTDSIDINLPIDAIRDKGSNKLTVSIDADNTTDELFETNNNITKEVVVFEDEARPVYPYNFSIVSKANPSFVASTANPFSVLRNYKIEVDTTTRFNSPQKVSTTKSSVGGILEFSPTLALVDSTVYYWRVGTVETSGQTTWTSYSSFIYLNNSQPGFNQSHYFQHTASTYQRMRLDSASRNLTYNSITNELYIRNGVWASATGQEGDIVVNVNGASYIRSHCYFNSLLFQVFDGKSFVPWQNENINGQGLYGSRPYCGTGQKRKYGFEFTNDSSGRRKALEFLRQIPDGNYIVFRNIILNDSLHTEFSPKWSQDAIHPATGNNFYQELKTNGFSVDSFYKPRVFAFVYKKGASNFAPQQAFSVDRFDVMALTVLCPTPDSIGFITSPVFGPAKDWKSLKWRGRSNEAVSTDQPAINVIGIKVNGAVDTLYRGIGLAQQDFDLSAINAVQYPYLQLRMRNADSLNYTPYQLSYWRVFYTPKPEGAIAPNLLFSMKDTFEVGEPINFKLAFKNVSDAAFDSVKVKVVLTDRNNVTRTNTFKLKPLASADTLVVSFPIDSRQITGANNLFVDINPDNDQPEQYHFNNFLYKNFFVYADTLQPFLDVTFDNQHILNGDLVASKPGISIKLRDNAHYQLLDDTSLVSVQIRFPNGDLKSYYFNNDTLQFSPATVSGSSGNQASITFKPYFAEDGDYELIVSGKDKSNNKAGTLEYRVAFKVINKAMISNMLNYPNPFTSSTAFVFTITGAEVPQNLTVQVLTITGKIVREITKNELGPLRVGRNITEFKWDGTDQYGQKLANGVYLYRVITNLNGKSLEKYKDSGDKTDKYFDKGYGKMYLMR
ncbi:MAG: hypothetical protein JWP88_1980 [Flaviaesturariibacter sp.]|nr:hypothetical protein [Flaviaesturariibacter sp.]